jgi:hypothetical protein
MILCRFVTLGICWNQTKHCLHPLHPPYKKGTKASSTTLAPLWLVKQLNDKKSISFTLGGRVCRKHLQEESNSRHPENKETLEPSDNIEADEIYEPEELYIPDNILCSSSKIGAQLTDILSISPIKFQINKTRINANFPHLKLEFCMQ